MRCTHCGSDVEDVGGHLRETLAYAAWTCALCSLQFYTLPQARRHFNGEFSRHPGSRPQIVESLDEEMEIRIREWVLGSEKSDKLPAGQPVPIKSIPVMRTSENHNPSQTTGSVSFNMTCTTSSASKDKSATNIPASAEAADSQGPGASFKAVPKITHQMEDEKADQMSDEEDIELPEPVELPSPVSPANSGENNTQTVSLISSEEETIVTAESTITTIGFLTDADDSLNNTETNDDKTTANIDRYFDPGAPVINDTINPGCLNKSESKTCRLCSKSVRTAVGYTNHVISAHWDDPMYFCTLCSFSAKVRDLKRFQSHLRHRHGRSDGSISHLFRCTRKSKEAGIQALRILCFGHFRRATDGLKTTAECIPCKKRITVDHLEKHLAFHHLKKPVFECRHCTFTESYWHPQATKRHLVREHKLPPTAEHYEDRKSYYVPEMRRLKTELLGNWVSATPLRQSLHCNLCKGHSVKDHNQLMAFKFHVAWAHLDEPQMSCRACPFFSMRNLTWSKAEQLRLESHFGRRHPGMRAGVVDHRERLRPTLDALLTLAFNVPPGNRAPRPD